MKANLWTVGASTLMIQPETTKYERDMRRMYVFILLILGLLALSGYVAIIY